MMGNSTPIGGPINPERHVSSGDRLGKRYRAADSMFTSTSVDDDDLLGTYAIHTVEYIEILKLKKYLTNVLARK